MTQDEKEVQERAAAEFENKQKAKKFVKEVLPKLSGNSTEQASEDNPDIEKAINESIQPAIDGFIEKYGIPSSRVAGESVEHFVERVNNALYKNNQNHLEGKNWGNCWPSTALEGGNVNCALGSLVLARALELGGEDKGNMKYGFPGPMSHAVIIYEGMYIDPTNGLILKVEPSEVVDGIETAMVLESDDPELMYKVPYRRIPLAPVEKGVAPLVWNLDSMQHRGGNIAGSLIEIFELDGVTDYSSLGRNILGENWFKKRMETQPEWQQEIAEVSARFED